MRDIISGRTPHPTWPRVCARHRAARRLCTNRDAGLPRCHAKAVPSSGCGAAGVQRWVCPPSRSGRLGTARARRRCAAFAPSSRVTGPRRIPKPWSMLVAADRLPARARRVHVAATVEGTSQSPPPPPPPHPHPHRQPHPPQPPYGSSAMGRGGRGGRATHSHDELEASDGQPSMWARRRCCHRPCRRRHRALIDRTIETSIKPGRTRTHTHRAISCEEEREPAVRIDSASRARVHGTR
jgi:hypothetical protein